jgi:hypothetical protein
LFLVSLMGLEMEGCGCEMRDEDCDREAKRWIRRLKPTPSFVAVMTIDRLIYMKIQALEMV